MLQNCTGFKLNDYTDEESRIAIVQGFLPGVDGH